jgi:hypothetical protein
MALRDWADVSRHPAPDPGLEWDLGHDQALPAAMLPGYRARVTGACQGTCRLSHAAKGCLSVACEAIVTTDSRSGLRVTAPIGVQSRVHPDQRAGLRSRAWTYTS